MPFSGFDFARFMEPEARPTLRKACRKGVRTRLARLAQEQADGRDVEWDSAAIAAHCTNCGKCPKLIAGMAFMLHPRRSGPPPGSR